MQQADTKTIKANLLGINLNITLISYLTCFKDLLRSEIKSCGSSKPICNLTMCSSLSNLKYCRPLVYSVFFHSSCKIARLSNPPQLYPIPNNSSELTNFITDDLLLLFITIDNNPVAPE